MSTQQIEFVDRYSAMGIPHPNTKTMCKGQCEGSGWFPEHDQSSQLWQEAHAKAHSLRGRLHRAWIYKNPLQFFAKCDGWHFVKCPDCNGTGLARAFGEEGKGAV